MRRRQQWAIGIGVAIIVLMGVYPPWMESYSYGVTRSIGYAPILTPPKNPTARVDALRLLLQCFSVAVVVGARIATVRENELKRDAGRGRRIAWREIRLGAFVLLLLALTALAIIARERWDDAVSVVALVVFLRFGMLFVRQVGAGRNLGGKRGRLRSLG